VKENPAAPTPDHPSRNQVLGWESITGSQARMLALERKPSVICSNSYLLAFPSLVVVVDPGADEEQTAVLKAAALAAAGRSATVPGGRAGGTATSHAEEPATATSHAGEPSTAAAPSTPPQPLPILVLITHAHRDHALAALDWVDGSVPGVTLALHARGADALRAGDARYTQSDLTGRTFPRIPVGLDLFTPGDIAPSEGARGTGGRRSLKLTGEESFGLTIGLHDISGLPNLTVHLPGGEMVDLLHTPGHSPDSLSLRVGDTLFVADVFFAANPGLAGIVGWDRGDLALTLAGLVRLLETGTISTLHPGHGHRVDTTEALTLLTKARDRVARLQDVVVLDRARAQFLNRYVRALLFRAMIQFSIITGRLLTVAAWLDELEEPERANRITAALDIDTVEGYLLEFRGFVESFVEGTSALTVPLKGLQIAKHIERNFGREGLQGVIDPDLLRRFGDLITDYVDAVNGFPIEAYAETIVLNDALEVLTARLMRHPGSDAEFLDSSDDEEAFVRQLILRLGHKNLFEEIVLAADLEPELPKVRVDRARFSDVTSGLLERLALNRAGMIELETYEEEREVQLAVIPHPHGHASRTEGLLQFPPHEWEYFTLTVELYGGALSRGTRRGHEALLMSLPHA